MAFPKNYKPKVFVIETDLSIVFRDRVKQRLYIALQYDRKQYLQMVRQYLSVDVEDDSFNMTMKLAESL